jgi:hypothetical protein
MSGPESTQSESPCPLLAVVDNLDRDTDRRLRAAAEALELMNAMLQSLRRQTIDVTVSLAKRLDTVSALAKNLEMRVRSLEHRLDGDAR